MNPIAYFSAEYAFDDLPIFAGGLGVLATDYLREAAEEEIPYVALGLFYRYGFAPADETDLAELDITAAGWEAVQTDDNTSLLLSVPLGGEDVSFRVWQKTFGHVTYYLLDTHVDDNTPEDQRITSFLYDKDFTTKFKQNALLGLGGVKALAALDITPRLLHLNEGHTALATVARLAIHQEQKPHATFEELCEAVTAETVASKHTVLSGAGMYISHDAFVEVLGRYLAEHHLPQEKVFALAQDPVRKDEFTTTRLMLQMARDTNAVSQPHQVYEDKLHPDSAFKLKSITNGINLKRWQHPDIASATAPENLWSTHNSLRQQLIEHVNQQTGSQLRPDVLTVVWARRITAYKRPLTVFEDLDSLQRVLTHEQQPIQILIAGKPNVEDEVGLEMARQIGEHVLNPRFEHRLAYLADYNLSLAHMLAMGADVWLNTPEQGYEASGTSGMKAGANGVLQCSVNDGWVEEAEIDKCGWVLPAINTSDAVYGYLEHEIAPLFYSRDHEGRPYGWIEYMEDTKQLVEENFTTHRMFLEYKQHLYHIS